MMTLDEFWKMLAPYDDQLKDHNVEILVEAYGQVHEIVSVRVIGVKVDDPGIILRCEPLPPR